MASVSAGDPLSLLLMLIGVLVHQHAVRGYDKLKLRAFKVPDYPENKRYAALDNLFKLIWDSDVTVLIWVNKKNAIDAKPLLTKLNEKVFTHSVKTSNDSAYSLYYKSEMFLDVSTEQINSPLIGQDRIFFATFKWSKFDGIPLSVAVLRTTKQSSTLGNILAQKINEEIGCAPFALFGDIPAKTFRNIYQNIKPEIQKKGIFRTRITSGVTRPALFLNSLATSFIGSANPVARDLRLLGIYYFAYRPLYSEFNLTRLRSELSAAPIGFKPTYPRYHRQEVSAIPPSQQEGTSAWSSMRASTELWYDDSAGRPSTSTDLVRDPSSRIPTSTQTHFHTQFSPGHGQLLQPLHGQSPGITSPGLLYTHKTNDYPPSAHTIQVAGEGSLSATTSTHGLGSPRMAPQSPALTHTSAVHVSDESRSPEMISPVHLYKAETNSRSNSPQMVSSRHVVHSDDTLQVVAFRVPAYTEAKGFDALQVIFSVLRGTDMAVLMWTDRGNANDAVTLLTALNIESNNKYSVQTSHDYAYSFYYSIKMFEQVSIECFEITKSPDNLCVATFKWAGFVGAPLLVAAFSPNIEQPLFAMELKFLVKENYGKTSLVFFGNFPIEYKEHNETMTMPALLLNSMETSLIGHFNPTPEKIRMYSLFQPPLYSEFNLTQLIQLSTVPREPQYDN